MADPDRSGSNHGPRGGLVARSAASSMLAGSPTEAWSAPPLWTPVTPGRFLSRLPRSSALEGRIVIARLLASGGGTLRILSADNESARRLAAEIGRGAVVAGDNRDALRGADAVVLALRFGWKGVIGEIADPLGDKVVVVPSNPLGTDAQGNRRLLPEGQSSGGL